jgi:CheY-like chemotaxis protein
MADHTKRILIVEDNDTDVRLLKDILETRGYNILQTKEGLEAIDLAVVNLPDLILMDIQLPDMSGASSGTAARISILNTFVKVYECLDTPAMALLAMVSTRPGERHCTRSANPRATWNS